MFRLVSERKRSYWIVVVLTSLLTYGFLLTNQSIGVDDENFAFYYDNYGVAVSGRYGYILLKKLFNTYAYFPVWRDGIAVVLLALGATIFVSLFKLLSAVRLSETACTVFAAIIVTYPLLGKMFVYISINIEVALLLVLASIALYFSFSYLETGKIRLLVYSTLLLTLGISMIENCLNYYVTGVILGLWTVLVFQNERFFICEGSQWKNLLKVTGKLLIFAGVSIVSIVLNAVIKKVMVAILKISYLGYTEKFMVWDFSNLAASIKNFVIGLVNVFEKYWQNTFYFKVYIIAVVLFVAGTVIIAWRRKNLAVLFLGVCAIISTLIFYLITGNVNMVTRTFVVYAVFAAFVFAFLYEGSRVAHVEKIVLCLTVFVIFYQSREIQQIYKDDYGRYIKDANMARDINAEIEKEWGGIPSVPVVFIGTPLTYIEYPNVEDDVNMRSIFHRNNDGKSQRVHAFFDMLGYHYVSPLVEELTIDNMLEMGECEYTHKAKQYAEDMDIWPAKGSVKATEDLIIVKLGPLEKQIYDMKEDEFERDVVKANCKDADGRIQVARKEGNHIYIRGYAYFSELSSRGTRISIVLEKGDKHYILTTEQSIAEGIGAEMDADGQNINAFLVWNEVPELSPGKWEISILLNNGQHTSFIEDENMKYLEIE